MNPERQLPVFKKIALKDFEEILPINFDTSNPEKISITLKINEDSPYLLKRIAEQEYFQKQWKYKYHLLTKREKEIISQIVEGNTNSQIADKLFISQRTVEQHRKNIRRKLDYPTELELLIFAQSFELI